MTTGVQFSSSIDKELFRAIKRLALELSVERECRVSFRALLSEALWDLLEKYEKVAPDERPFEEGARRWQR